MTRASQRKRKRRSSTSSSPEPSKNESRKPESKAPVPSEPALKNKKKKPKPPPIPCDVCHEDMNETTMPTRVITEQCGHESIICIPCIQVWVDSQIRSGIVVGFRCPEVECGAVMSVSEAMSWASDWWRQRLEEKLRRRELERNPDFHWCLGHNCGSGQLHNAKRDGHIFICSTCGHQTCTVCNKPGHPSKPCEPKVLSELAASEFELQKKQCPNPDCQVPITHAGDGCHLLDCTQCNTEFCFYCLGLSIGGLEDHREGCPTIARREEHLQQGQFPPHLQRRQFPPAGPAQHWRTSDSQSDSQTRGNDELLTNVLAVTLGMPPTRQHTSPDETPTQEARRPRGQPRSL